jgi:hypothetical protein
MAIINDKEIPVPHDFGIDSRDNQQIYDWIRDNNHPDTDQHFGCALPWLMLSEFPEWPHQEMLAEAKALDEQGLIPDYNSGNNLGWAAVALYGLSSDSTLPPEEYGYASYKEAREAGALHWTEIADQCPVTTEFFKTKFNYKRYNRIRFMALRPGGVIRWHNDVPEGEDPTFDLGVVNISLNNPENCFFNMGLWGNIPITDGCMWLFGNNHYHMVRNNHPTETRYHMIASGTPNELFWKDVVANSFRRTWPGEFIDYSDERGYFRIDDQHWKNDGEENIYSGGDQ